MGLYRKKPVVIEAVTWYGKFEDETEWPDWFRTAMDNGTLGRGANRALSIVTLEGPITASIGDYVIKGVKGELYPCKPDIFEATYEYVGPVPAGVQ